MQKNYKRPIVAKLYRSSSKGGTEVAVDGWVRYYNSLCTAMRKAVELVLSELEPGDCIHLSHSNFGFEIAKITPFLDNQGMLQISISVEEIAVPDHWSPGVGKALKSYIDEISKSASLTVSG